jgi:hypothetical protein
MSDFRNPSMSSRVSGVFVWLLLASLLLNAFLVGVLL